MSQSYVPPSQRRGRFYKKGWGKLYRVTEHAPEPVPEGPPPLFCLQLRRYRGGEGPSPDPDWDQGPNVCLTPSQQAWAQPGRKLGCGAFACAYSRPDSNVVKFTTDPSDVAALMAGKRHPRIARIREAKKLAQYEKQPIYAAIVERLDKPSREIATAAEAVRIYRDLLQEEFTGSRSKGTPAYKVSRQMQSYLASACYRVGRNEGPAFAEKCRAFAAEAIKVHEFLGKRGFGFFDIHEGNVGTDSSGNWRFLDVGYSSQSKVPDVEKIAGARRRRKRRRK